MSLRPRIYDDQPGECTSDADSLAKDGDTERAQARSQGPHCCPQVPADEIGGSDNSRAQNVR